MGILKGRSEIELKEIELKTFKFLKSNQCVLESFNDLAVKAGHQYDALRKKDHITRKDINFESYFDVPVKDALYRFHVGALIKKDHISYYLALCTVNSSNTCEIKRKYHFDYVAKNKKKDYPIFHLQYGGEKPPALGSHDNNQYDAVLIPWLSEPRLFFPPMTLALIIHCVLKEFETDVTKKLQDDGTWRKIIEDNEKAILKPFFEQCQNFLGSSRHNKENLFLTEYCYGK